MHSWKRYRRNVFMSHFGSRVSLKTRSLRTTATRRFSLHPHLLRVLHSTRSLLLILQVSPVLMNTYDTDIPVIGRIPSTTPMPHDRETARDRLHSSKSTSTIRLQLHGLETEPLSPAAFTQLTDQGYTRGLIEALTRNKIAFPLRIWVVDNSGSMAQEDGHKLLETTDPTKVKFVSCSRWVEMQQTVDYHAQMAALLRSPTVFRMLNDPGRICGPQQFSVAERGDFMIEEDLQVVRKTIMNSSPNGVTPLIPHLHDIRENILEMAPALRQAGAKVAIILATDGLPTDELGYSSVYVKRQFVEALRLLEGLPVWLVVRLCTDEEAVVDFWNNLDGQLELSLEVLDDFVSEAEEIHGHNKWLNYALPLHRMREMGFHSKLFDVLDERQLGKSELRDFFRILFGDGMMDGVPDPLADWDGFFKSVSVIAESEKPQYNPVTKRVQPWIDIKQLKKDYGPGLFGFLRRS